MDKREQLCEDLDEPLEVYDDIVYRIALQNMGNIVDTRDVAQDVFLHILKKEPQFTSTTHEKVWILRVTVSIYKDYWKHQRLRKTVELREDLAEVKENTDFDLLCEVIQLPIKHRNIIYLFYYEGPNVVMIAGILQRKEATTLTWLYWARKQLKDRLEEGDKQ